MVLWWYFNCTLDKYKGLVTDRKREKEEIMNDVQKILVIIFDSTVQFVTAGLS